MAVVAFFARCIDWLKRELEKTVEYDWDDGFFLILPPQT
jgi:hypothetical protein